MSLSYSNDLWSGQDTIQVNFNKERNRIKNLLFVFQEKKNLEMEYAQNLKILSNYYNTLKPSSNQKENCFDSLNKAIELLFNQIKSESEIHMENVSFIENTIIHNLGELLSHQFTKAKELDKEFQCDTISKFKDVIKEFDKKQQDYFSSLQIAENKIYSDQQVIEENIQKGKTNFKLSSKEQKSVLNSAKTKKAEYMKIVKDTNESRANYINKMQQIMSEYQNLDDEFLKFVKVKLNAYSNANINLFNALKGIYVKEINIYNTISTDKDINNFIEKNKTFIRPPGEFKFVPYSSELVSQRIGCKKLPKDNIYSKVVKIIEDNLFTKTEQFDTLKNDYEFINKEVISIFDDNHKDDSSNDKIIFLLQQEERYRTYFLNTVNNFRIRGLFQITKRAYKILLSLMNFIIEKSFTEEDYKNIKLCMILSTAFYTGEDKKRIDQDLCNNQLFTQEQTWRNLIVFSIDEKLNCVNSYENFFGENQAERVKKLKMAVKENLLIYRYNMHNFKYPLEKAKLLIEECGHKYGINVDEIYGVNIDPVEFAEQINKASHELMIG